MSKGGVWWRVTAVVLLLLLAVMAAIPSQVAAVEVSEATVALMPFQEGRAGDLASILLYSLLGFVVASLALLLLNLFRRWRDGE